MMYRLRHFVRLLIFAGMAIFATGPVVRAQAPDALPMAEVLIAASPTDPLGRGTPRGMVNGLIATLGENDFARRPIP